MITLEYNGTEQSLADWGFDLNSVQFVGRNLDVHSLSAVRVGDTISSAAIFPYRAKIILRLDRTGSGTSWSDGYVDFIGYRIRQLTRSTGEFFGVTYTFENFWHFLNNTLYVQFTATRDNDGETLLYKQVPELLLFQELDGSNILQPLTSGQQIAAILQFVLDAFAAQGMDQPFIIGDIDPQLGLFSYQARQLMCAAAILKCLELSPDVNVVVDYTTAVSSVPTPTINFKLRANWNPVSLALHNGVDHESLNIEPRYDLVPRGVLVWYKITGADSGAQWVLNIADKYGPTGQGLLGDAVDWDNGLDVITQFVDVQGRQTAVVSAPIETEDVDAASATDADRFTWWKVRCPKLKSGKIKIVAIDTGSVEVTEHKTETPISLATYPRELIKGVLPAWTDKTTKWVNVKCLASYDVYTTSAAATSSVGGLLHHRVVDEEITVRLQVTDAETTTYTKPTESITGEPVPGLVSIVDGIATFANGLAKSIYQTLATLQWEGDDVRVEVEPTNQVTFGDSVNLTGGLAAWATMNAQVRAITKHYGSGETTVSFGPSPLNNADALFKIIQFTRPRFVWWNNDLRETANQGDSGGEVEASGDTPKENTDTGSGTKAAIAATATVSI